MKLLIIVLVLHYATDSNSSCVLQDEFVDFFSTSRESLNETRPLINLIKYKEVKKELKRFLHTKLETKNCSIKDVCSKVINRNEHKLKDCHQFCKKYFFFEYNSNHVYKVNRLEMWFISYENVIFHSNEILNKSRAIFTTAMLEQFQLY